MNCSNRSKSLHYFIVEVAAQLRRWCSCCWQPVTWLQAGFLRRQSLSSLFLYFTEQIIHIRSPDLESELCDLVSDVRFAKFVIKYKSLLGTAALCWPAALYTPERTLKSRSSLTNTTIMIMMTTTVMITYCHPSRAVPLGGWGGTQWHPEALQPQRQHHQHLPGSGAQQSTLLLQAGSGGRWLQ